MNILFLSIGRLSNLSVHGIYTDLLREFRDNGHNVYVMCPTERKEGKPTSFGVEEGINVLRVKIGNIKKCNIIEKGISTILIEPQFKAAIKKYYSSVKFDLVMYSTPPITFANVIDFVKKRDGAASYLILKDIFPQNAVDIGVMTKTGIKGLLYKYFRAKEKNLYDLSDKIGCMSQANVDFVLKHNSDVASEKVEVCPNSADPIDMSISTEEKIAMREKYGIPLDKKVFVYGGNLGKPQGIPFLIECLKNQANNELSYFLIVGDGTENGKLDSYIKTDRPKNVKLMKRLPKEDYDRMVAACDVGLIFLDHRFTIPNFPSRLLSYMQAGIPVLACTDPNTDIGKVITEGGFGWHCQSNDVEAFGEQICLALAADLSAMGEKGFAYLREHYHVEKSCRTILRHFGGK